MELSEDVGGVLRFWPAVADLLSSSFAPFRGGFSSFPSGAGSSMDGFGASGMGSSFDSSSLFSFVDCSSLVRSGTCLLSSESFDFLLTALAA